jgi:hypothetical protein
MPQPPHVWDNGHETLLPTDPADKMNCAIASLAMLNNFYGGDLLQDRIGYEAYSKNVRQYAGVVTQRNLDPPTQVPLELAPGPERDLNYGYGMSLEHIVAAGMFALGAAPGRGSGRTSVAAIWSAAVSEINAGRPLIGFNTTHAFVIRGYEIQGNRQLLYVNDPWAPTNPATGLATAGQYAIDIGSTHRLGQLKGFISYPIQPDVADLEPNFDSDSDSDGVTDFDEIERFRTNPNNKDSDGDGVEDKIDIKSGVYEYEHAYGYAWNPAYGNPGRDFDADGKPTELDPDSDNGGCKDGEEDLDKDGFHTPNEPMGNFDQTDDECASLIGNVSYSSDVIGTDPNNPIKRGHAEGTIRVKLKPEQPGSDHYVDDSSSFTFSGYGRLEVALGRCVVYGRESAVGGGLFDPGAIGATRGDDRTLAFSAEATIPGNSSSTGCNSPAGGNQTYLSMAFPDCVGQRSTRTVQGWTTYRFNCNQRDSVPGGLSTRFVARGFIRVVTP